MMKRVKWLVVIGIVSIFVWCMVVFVFSSEKIGTTGDAMQSLDSLRKAEKMYFNENKQYTGKMENLGKYTNITKILQFLDNKKVDIKLSKNKKHFTITGKTNYGCSKITANDKGVFIRTKKGCIDKVVTKDFFIRVALFIFINVLCIFISYLFSFLLGSNRKIIFKSCCIYFLTMWSCMFISSLFINYGTKYSDLFFSAFIFITSVAIPILVVYGYLLRVNLKTFIRIKLLIFTIIISYFSISLIGLFLVVTHLLWF